MSRRIPYHLDNGLYTLAFVAPTRSAADHYCSTVPAASVVRKSIDTSDDRRLTLIYRRSSTSSPTPSECSWTPPDSDGTAAITAAALYAHAEIAATGSVPLNKPFEPATLSRTIDRIEWKQSVGRVAGDLLSSMILAHPFPNANHRTGLALTSLYLESRNATPSISDAIHDETVSTLIDRYQVTSKRLLTVRRNTTAFTLLAEAGVTSVVRKGGIEIHLDEYDLTVHDPLATFAECHQDVSAALIRDVLTVTEQLPIASSTDPGKHAFVQWLDAA